MAQPILVQQGWSRMVRDVSRDQLDGVSLWNMVDMIPEIGAPARCRGPWTYYGPSTGFSIDSLFWADFSTS